MVRAASRATPRRLSALACLISAFLVASALAGCGASTTSAGARGPGSPISVRTTATPTPGAAQTPTQPLSFPEQWRSATGVGLVSGFGFGVASSTGYACTMGSLPGTAQMPALELTHDGGASWSPVTNAPFMQSFGCSAFVDQHNAADVFVQALVNDPAGSGKQVPILWRTTDGGATWKRLAPHLAPQGASPWLALFVVRSRIVALAGPINPGEGGVAPRNGLFASDDGGASWQQLGQSIAGTAQQLSELTTMGDTLVVRTQACQYPCDTSTALPLPVSQSGATSLAAPLSAGAPPATWWMSGDGGNTWSRMPISDAYPHVQYMVFTPAANQSGYYGVALANGVNPNNLVEDALLFSEDSGATWTRLPALNGPASGYGDGRYLGANHQALATPDGAVVAAFWHSFEDVSNQSPSVGVVSLRRGDSTWQVFAPGGVSTWQLAGLPGAVRLWGLQAMSDEPFVSMAVP